MSSIKRALLIVFAVLLVGLLVLRGERWIRRVQWEITERLSQRLDRTLREIAGPGAKDCGRVPVRGERTSTDRCVVSEFQAGKPFYARYDLQGIDSYVAGGLAGTAQGQVYSVLFDSDPYDLRFSIQIKQELCVAPVIVTVQGEQRLVCRR